MAEFSDLIFIWLISSITWLLSYFWNPDFITFCHNKTLFSSQSFLISLDGFFFFLLMCISNGNLGLWATINFLQLTVILWVIISKWLGHLWRNNSRILSPFQTFLLNVRPLYPPRISNMACLKLLSLLSFSVEECLIPVSILGIHLNPSPFPPGIVETIFHRPSCQMASGLQNIFCYCFCVSLAIVLSALLVEIALLRKSCNEVVQKKQRRQQQHLQHQ